MSTVAVKKVKLGDNADLSKNFLIEVPAVADGTLTIKREDGTNVLSVAADGGIDLNATWKSYTPVLQGGTTAGVGTYTVQDGEYLDFGSFVFVKIRLDWSAHTGTGPMLITLPLPPSMSVVNPMATYANGVNVGPNHAPMSMVTNAGGGTIQLYGLNTVSSTNVNIATMDTIGSLAIAGVYRKA